MQQEDLFKEPDTETTQRPIAVVREEIYELRRELRRKERLISRLSVEIANHKESDTPAMLGSDTSMADGMTNAIHRCQQIVSEISELEIELMGRWAPKSMLPEPTEQE
jgi:hypothetical protein